MPVLMEELEREHLQAAPPPERRSKTRVWMVLTGATLVVGLVAKRTDCCTGWCSGSL